MTAAAAEDAAPRRFGGFPAGARATAVPSLVFTELLPAITDADELRLTLYVIYALGRRRGYPRFVTASELAADAPLLAALGDGSDPSQPGRDVAVQRLERALELALTRGTLLGLELQQGQRTERLYFLNAPADRRALELIRDGRLDLGRPLPPRSGAPASTRNNVYRLYEENVGALTPIVAEELKEAEQLYPHDWLEEAFREAALLNKRSWRYVARILERWATEGREREKAGRDPAEAASARSQILRRYREIAGGR